MEQLQTNLLDTGLIEVHYWFYEDHSHSMNAFIQNKCEYEILGVLKGLAAIFDFEIIIETEPLAEGGLIRRFTVLINGEFKDKPLKLTLLTALFTTLFFSPLTTSIGEVSKHLIDKVFEDKEKQDLATQKLKADIEDTKSHKQLQDLEIEKKKIEIENLKADAKLKSQRLDTNTSISKKRSNFYESLERYDNVKQVSFKSANHGKSPNEVFIPKSKFKEFILASDELDPTEVNDAIIEIVSPVLKKGNYKWRGIYQGEIVSFNMKSNEFKASVQAGIIEFKNGFTIKCLLEIEKRIDGEGKEKIEEYNIIRVDEYFLNEQPIVTNEGKKHRQKIEAEKQQIKLFDDNR